MVTKDYCDLCEEEMHNFYTFTWDFKPTWTNVYRLKDDEDTINICSDCKKIVKKGLFKLLNDREESKVPGIDGTIKYT